MHSQQDCQEQAADELPVWEAPELVKVDVSAGTLNGAGAIFDGVTPS
jgi:hypothetical protein